MFGDIVLCRFPFTSGVGSKVRPALILFDLNSDAVICRVTSSTAKSPSDVELADWQAAGLLKNSVARLDRLVTAERTIFIKRLGKLTPGDLNTVRAIWNLRMTL
jgi:mRNA interferase MazF